MKKLQVLKREIIQFLDIESVLRHNRNLIILMEVTTCHFLTARGHLLAYDEAERDCLPLVSFTFFLQDHLTFQVLGYNQICRKLLISSFHNIRIESQELLLYVDGSKRTENSEYL
jgi:hypothetical protein